jgi:hypothetical protein
VDIVASSLNRFDRWISDCQNAVWNFRIPNQCSFLTENFESVLEVSFNVSSVPIYPWVSCKWVNPRVRVFFPSFESAQGLLIDSERVLARGIFSQIVESALADSKLLCLR